MGVSDGHRVPQSMSDWMRAQEKRSMHEERRPRVAQAQDIMGPGLGPMAVEIADWNGPETEFNGFYVSRPGALHSPDLSSWWMGQSISQDGQYGIQYVWDYRGETSPPSVFVRRFAIVADGTRFFSTWQPISTPGAEGNTVWLNGTGPPTSTDGQPGFYWLDNLTGEYYEKIDTTTWVLRGDLTGPQGPEGPPGEAGIVWQGEWFPGFTYDVNDGVTYLGASYRRVIAGQTNTPPPDDEITSGTGTNWELLADKGEEGPQGPEGPQGSQGIPGPPGPDGQALYTWLKYADSPTTGMSDDPTGKTYLGLAYNKTDPTESANYADYTWSSMVGPQGDQGVPGPPGPDGQPTYTWIKYGTSATGAGLSDDPTGRAYIGIAYNKTTTVESTDPADYTWSLIQGPTGPEGPEGPTGPEGPIGDTGPPGPPGLRWLGEWNPLTAYVVNDAVTYQGSSYRRKVAGTTATAPVGDNVNWELIARSADLAPTVAPDTVTLDPSAVGTVASILLNIPPVDHESPYTAKVYISTTNPPSLIDSGLSRTLHGWAQGSTYRIASLPVDGQDESLWPKLELGILYYIVVVPTNTAGDGDPSPVVSAQLHAIDTDDFAATYAYFGEINVDQLRGDTFELGEGTVTAVRAAGLNGAEVEMHGLNGLTVRGSKQANGTIPVYVAFPMDGSKATLPEVLSVKTEQLESESAELGGTTTVLRGGKILLASAIGAPLSAPTLTTDYHTVAHPPNGEEEEHSGLTKGPDGRWYTCERDYYALGRMTVQAFNADGTFSQEFTLSDPDGHELEPLSIVWDSLNSRFWVLCMAGAANDNYLYCDSYTSAWGYVSHDQLGQMDLDYSGRVPILGWDYVANRLLLAWTSSSTNPNPGRLWVDSYAKNSGAEGLNEAGSTRFSTSTASGFSIDGNLGYIGYGAFDLDANRYVVAAKNASVYPYFYVFDPAHATPGTRDTGREWEVAAGAWVFGAWWDGSGSTGRFWSIDGGNRRRRYEGGRNTWTDQRGGKVRRVKHSWYDSDSLGTGTHETPLSNAKEITLPKRARLTVTVGRIPVGVNGVDDPDKARIYVGTTAGSDTGLTREAEVTDPETTFTQDTLVNQLGGTHVTTPFPSGTPSSLETTTGGVKIEADGSGSVGTAGFAASVRAEAAAAIPTGTVNMYAGAAAPSGWLLCDGTAVSRTTYSALYAVIGTTYGIGNGSSTFNVPDFRMRLPLGAGSSKVRGGTEAPTEGTSTSNPSGGLLEANRGIRHQHSHDHGPNTLSTNNAGSHTHKMGAHDHGSGTMEAGGANQHVQVNNTPISGSAPRLTGPTTHTHTVTGMTGEAGAAIDTGDSSPSLHAHNVNSGRTSTELQSQSEHPHLGVHFIVKT